MLDSSGERMTTANYMGGNENRVWLSRAGQKALALPYLQVLYMASTNFAHFHSSVRDHGIPHGKSGLVYTALFEGKPWRHAMLTNRTANSVTMRSKEGEEVHVVFKTGNPQLTDADDQDNCEQIVTRKRGRGMAGGGPRSKGTGTGATGRKRGRRERRSQGHIGVPATQVLKRRRLRSKQPCPANNGAPSPETVSAPEGLPGSHDQSPPGTPKEPLRILRCHCQPRLRHQSSHQSTKTTMWILTMMELPMIQIHQNRQDPVVPVPHPARLPLPPHHPAHPQSHRRSQQKRKSKQQHKERHVQSTRSLRCQSMGF